MNNEEIISYLKDKIDKKQNMVQGMLVVLEGDEKKQLQIINNEILILQKIYNDYVISTKR